MTCAAANIARAHAIQFNVCQNLQERHEAKFLQRLRKLEIWLLLCRLSFDSRHVLEMTLRPRARAMCQCLLARATAPSGDVGSGRTALAWARAACSSWLWPRALAMCQDSWLELRFSRATLARAARFWLWLELRARAAVHTMYQLHQAIGASHG